MQVIVAFVLGLLIVHDLTAVSEAEIENPLNFPPRASLTPLLFPVQSTPSEYTARAVGLAVGFWIVEAGSDLLRLAADLSAGKVH